MTGRETHRTLTLVFSLLMLAAGTGVVVETIAGISPVAAPRLIVGVLLIAAGAGRTYVEIRRGRGA